MLVVGILDDGAVEIIELVGILKEGFGLLRRLEDGIELVGKFEEKFKKFEKFGMLEDGRELECVDG